MVLYGFIAFVFPFVAGKLIPQAWEWPVKNPAQALVLGDGRLADSTGEGVGRIQIYDQSGRYLTGWPPPDNDGIGVTILGFGVDHGLAEAGPNTTLVDYSRAQKIILFGPEGKILLEQDRPKCNKASPQGCFVEKSFKSPWYKWPLGHPIRGWPTIAAGGLGLAIISFLTGRFGKDG